MHVVAVRQHRDGERAARCADPSGSCRGCARPRGRAVPGSRGGSTRRSRSCASAMRVIATSTDVGRPAMTSGEAFRRGSPRSPASRPAAARARRRTSVWRSCAGWIGTRTRVGTKLFVARVAALAGADRHREAKLVDRAAGPLVVAAERAREAGDEHVVDAARRAWSRRCAAARTGAPAPRNGAGASGRCITSERAASVTSAWRWIEREQAGGIRRPGPGPRSGWVTTWPAVSMVRRTTSMPRCAASTHRVRVASRERRRRRGRRVDGRLVERGPSVRGRARSRPSRPTASDRRRRR